MKIIRKSIGTMLILGAAAAGCAGDAEPPTQPSTGQSPAPRTSGNLPAVKIGDEGDKASKGGPSQPPPVMIPAPSDGKKATEAPKVEGPSKADTSKPTGAASKLTADDLAAIKELPKDEQDVALAQAICPVSSHNLGSMGKPLKVTAAGRTFYLCCDECQKDVKSDPKAVIAKLDKLKAAK